jgi:hypothetical protein
MWCRNAGWRHLFLMRKRALLFLGPGFFMAFHGLKVPIAAKTLLCWPQMYTYYLRPVLVGREPTQLRTPGDTTGSNRCGLCVVMCVVMCVWGGRGSLRTGTSKAAAGLAASDITGTCRLCHTYHTCSPLTLTLTLTHIHACMACFTRHRHSDSTAGDSTMNEAFLADGTSESVHSWEVCVSVFCLRRMYPCIHPCIQILKDNSCGHICLGVCITHSCYLCHNAHFHVNNVNLN